MIDTAARRTPTSADAVATAEATPAEQASVELLDVSVRYGAVTVLDQLNLGVADGELLALLGPSGSGKTTILRTIAGFVLPDAGCIFLSGRDVTETPPHRRGIGVVFQSYALFPHMTVAENLAYPLKAKRTNKAKIAARCDELLEMVRLPGLGKMRPAQLSGGQQQRVALARALAMDPEVLLLDEPLSNLDANLRRDVGAEIRRLQRSTGTTAVMVTHDRQEAFGMADRIAVLRDGAIEQLGTPRELYRTPRSRFMAEFVGDANLIRGRVVDSNGGETVIDTPLGRLQLPGEPPQRGVVDVLMRPEDLRLGAAADPLGVGFTATLRSAYYYGPTVVAELDVAGGHTMTAVASGSSASVPGDGESVAVSIAAADVVLVPVPEQS